MGFNNKRQPFPFRNGGNPGPVTLGPGVPQFHDNEVVLTVNVQVDKRGVIKLNATQAGVPNGMPHPLQLVKLFTGLIQGQADYLLMQESMIIDPNKARGTNDGTETGSRDRETGEQETTDDNRGNPTPVQ